jgi:lauroyl/myristoyl acyltransferase
VRCLPVASLSSYGGKIGLLTFYLLRGWRGVALNNLNLAFGKEKDKDEIQWICRELFKNMGRDTFRFENDQKCRAGVTSNLAHLTKIIESAVREHPEQWLWIYRRFKRARDIQTGERISRKSS